jgi:hypothetical protein
MPLLQYETHRFQAATLVLIDQVNKIIAEYLEEDWL